MYSYNIIRLTDMPQIKCRATEWFHEKWHIPLSAYEQSMSECLKQTKPVPQWYLALNKNDGNIIGGLGVIENDFHDRVDLAPNVCAVYVEREFRCRGIAGEMLDFVCRDMHKKGISTLYLVTDHIGFYERYGWRFLCMVQGDGEDHLTRLYIHESK